MKYVISDATLKTFDPIMRSIIDVRNIRSFGVKGHVSPDYQMEIETK